MVDVPKEFQNVSVEDWAVGALYAMSLIAGNLRTEHKWSDERIEETFSRLAATAPLPVALGAANQLMEDIENSRPQGS